MLRGRVDFSLISNYPGDKALGQSHFMVKLNAPPSALNPGDLRVGANPESSIPIFASRFEAGIRQTGC